MATELEKASFPAPKGSGRECTIYCTVALISQASKIMLKILQARIQQYVNREFPDVQAGFRKGRGTRDQIAIIHWIIEKRESSRKTSTSALLTMPKTLTVWITTHCRKFLKRWNTRAPDLPPERSACRSRSSSSNWTWNNGLLQNWERSMSRLHIVTLLI